MLGASLGGAATVAEAPKLKDVAGVISLSGELELPTSELDAIGAAPKITVPFLFVGSEADGYVLGSEARRLTRAVGSTTSRRTSSRAATTAGTCSTPRRTGRASSRCSSPGSASTPARRSSLVLRMPQAPSLPTTRVKSDYERGT